MNNRVMLSLCAAALLALAGCSDSEQPPAPSEGTGKAGGESTMEMVKEQAQAAMDSASKAGSEAMEAISKAASATKDQGEKLAGSTSREVRALIDQARTYLAEHNLDSAQGIMEQISHLGQSMSEQSQAEVDNLEEQISARREQAED